MFLYLPFSTWSLIGAARDGVRRTAIMTGIIAGIVMAVSIVAAARQFAGATR